MTSDTNVLDRSPDRVLIIKPSALGDVVTAVPVLRGLRRSFPNCHIAWLVAGSCVDLIRHDSDLNEVILFDRKKSGSISPAGLKAISALKAALAGGQFDLVIDLQGLLRSGLMTMATRAAVRAGFADAREGAAKFYTHAVKVTAPHTVDRNIELAKFLKIDARPADFTLQVSPQGRQFADVFLRQSGLRAKGFVACVPPTRWPTKVYPVRHWRAVIAQLAKQLPVVLLGGPGDVEMCAQAAGDATGAINLAGKTSVAQMVAVIAAARGVICSDSAAKFIAPAVGTNVLTLLGPTKLDRTGPYVPGPWVKARSIVAEVPCQGCLRRRCSHTTCMQSIRPEQVVTAATEMLNAEVAEAAEEQQR